MTTTKTLMIRYSVVFVTVLFLLSPSRGWADAVDECKDFYQGKQYKKAMIACTKAAQDDGGALSVFNLGALFYFGKGTEKDYKQAFHWFRLAAKQGIPEAQFNVGIIYQLGQGTEINLTKAFHWYLKAAEQGMPDAQLYVGKMYQNGQGTEINLAKAFHWYLKAAEQGVPDAQNYVGGMYYFGSGTEKNVVQAEKWLKKAVAKDIPQAQTVLGMLYLQSEVKDFIQGISWLKKAADQGYIDGKNMLQAIVNGLQKSAKSGDAEDQYYLAELYSKGLAVPRDADKAFGLYEKAATQGDAKAQFKLGAVYEDGKVVQEDFNIALHWYQKSARGNVAEAKTAIDSLLQKILERADKGNVDAQIELAQWYGERHMDQPKDESSALYWLDKAVRSGSKSAAKSIKEIFFSRESSDILKQCLEASYYLLRHDQLEDAIQRYASCRQNSITGLTDTLAYLEFGGHVFSWTLINSDAHRSAIKLFLAQTRQFTADRLKNDMQNKKDAAKEAAIGVAASGILFGGSLSYANAVLGSYFQRNESLYYGTFEKQHPFPTLDSSIVAKQIEKFTLARYILKTQSGYIRQINNETSTDNIKRVAIYQSIVEENKRKLMRNYSRFINDFVILPILNRTNQLLYIADAENWIGSDDDYMDQAAKMFGRINQLTLLSASQSNRDFSRKLLSKFKDQGGEAKIKDLKAIQSLNGNDLDSHGVDDWINE